MLILSRKKGQRIVIGKDIVVTVKEIRGNTVRLSIETPHGVPVFREEILADIENEMRRAALNAARERPLPSIPSIALDNSNENGRDLENQD